MNTFVMKVSADVKKIINKKRANLVWDLLFFKQTTKR